MITGDYSQIFSFVYFYNSYLTLTSVKHKLSRQSVFSFLIVCTVTMCPVPILCEDVYRMEDGGVYIWSNIRSVWAPFATDKEIGASRV